MSPTVAAAIAGTFLLSAVTTGLMLRYSRRLLIDRPNLRSSHTRPTPTGGGIGFLLAFAAGALALVILGGAQEAARLLPAIALIVPLAVIGLVDDRRGAARSLRGLVQLGVAAALVSLYGRFPLPLFPDDASGMLASFLVCTVAAMAVINFYNFMDGMDGLVAGCTATQMVFWGIWQQQPLWWLLAAALGGFLVWNWFPARIFMGDVGSTALGALVVVALLVQTPASGWSWHYVVVALPLLGDAGYTLLRRLLRGENVFVAHHSHLYQRMIRARWPHSRIAIFYVALATLMALLTAWLDRAGVLASALTFLAFVVAAEWVLARRKVPFAVGDGARTSAA